MGEKKKDLTPTSGTFQADVLLEVGPELVSDLGEFRKDPRDEIEVRVGGSDIVERELHAEAAEEAKTNT